MSYIKLLDDLKENLKTSVDQIEKIDKSLVLKVAAGGLIGCGVLYGL